MGLRIAGNDLFNAEQEKREHAAAEERRHAEMLAAQNESNKIAREANDIAKNANRKSKFANIVAFISTAIALGSLIVAIVALCK